MIFSEKITKFFLYGTMFFNIIDAFVTVRVVKYGHLEENNPIMKYMLDIGVLPFVAFKTTLVAMGVYILWKYRNKLIAQIGAYFCFSFYWTLICLFYHFLYLK